MKRMIWLTIQALITFYMLVKGVKYYNKLQKLYLQLKNNPLTNVAQIKSLLKNKQPLQRVFVILKGIAKCNSKIPQQKDILSLIQIKDLRIKPAMYSSLQKIKWSKILQNAFHCKPRNLKYLKFQLKDLISQQKIDIVNCQKSNITGALTQIYSDTNIQPAINSYFIKVINKVYEAFISCPPFSYFFKKLKYGQEIKYFAIMDGQFIEVVGQVFKTIQAGYQIRQPRYLTKQKAFIEQRLKRKMKYLYWIILVLMVIKLYVLYRIGKKVVMMYLKKRQNEKGNKQEERSQSQGDIVNCIICYTNIRSLVLKPCRHYGFCNQCYQSFKEKGCPLCKTQITGVLEIVKKK